MIAFMWMQIYWFENRSEWFAEPVQHDDCRSAGHHAGYGLRCLDPLAEHDWNGPRSSRWTSSPEFVLVDSHWTLVSRRHRHRQSWIALWSLAASRSETGRPRTIDVCSEFFTRLDNWGQRLDDNVVTSYLNVSIRPRTSTIIQSWRFYQQGCRDWTTTFCG